MLSFYWRCVTAQLQTGEFLMNGPAISGNRRWPILREGVKRAISRGNRVLPGNSVRSASKQFERARLVFVTYIGNRQQDARKRLQITSVFSGHPQVRDTTLLVAGQSAHAQQPAHRRRHAADNVLAESGRHQHVGTVVDRPQEAAAPRWKPLWCSARKPGSSSRSGPRSRPATPRRGSEQTTRPGPWRLCSGGRGPAVCAWSSAA